jgi:hypothetical protein
MGKVVRTNSDEEGRKKTLVLHLLFGQRHRQASRQPAAKEPQHSTPCDSPQPTMMPISSGDGELLLLDAAGGGVAGGGGGAAQTGVKTGGCIKAPCSLVIMMT